MKQHVIVLAGLYASVVAAQDIQVPTPPDVHYQIKPGEGVPGPDESDTPEVLENMLPTPGTPGMPAAQAQSKFPGPENLRFQLHSKSVVHTMSDAVAQSSVIAGEDVKIAVVGGRQVQVTGVMNTGAKLQLDSLSQDEKKSVMLSRARLFIESQGGYVLGADNDVEYVVRDADSYPGGGSVIYGRSVAGVPCSDSRVTVVFDGEGNVKRMSGNAIDVDAIKSALSGKLISKEDAFKVVRDATGGRETTLEAKMLCNSGDPYVIWEVVTTFRTYHVNAITGELL